MRSKWMLITGYSCIALVFIVVAYSALQDFWKGEHTISCGGWPSLIPGCTSEAFIGLFLAICLGMVIFVGVKEQKKIRKYNAGERKNKKRKKKKK